MDSTEYIEKLENLLKACIYQLEQYSENDCIETEQGFYIPIAELKSLIKKE